MKYVCPMHPEVVADKPGQCPKCGGMALVPMGSAETHDHGGQADHMSSPGAAQDFLRRWWGVTVLLVPLILASRLEMKYLQLLVATAIFYLAGVFFEHAKHEIKAKQYGMMTLVAMAVGAGYLFSAAGTFIPALQTEFYVEISTLIWVLLLGHYLEARSSAAAGDALAEVAKLLPKQAHLWVRGKIQEVEIEALKAGDVVVVKPGEKVPADGVIVEGQAHFNEAHISGESRPVGKREKDEVVAGAICEDGSVRVRLMRVGEESTIGQIKQLVMEAGKTKPKMQAVADKAAQVLTVAAMSVAVATVLVWSGMAGQPLVFSVTLAITVLVIACPHALGLAIPTVTTIATRLAVGNGLFVKNLRKLETVKDIDYVMFDKTGTLTRGEFGVVEVKGDVVKVAGSLEQHSSHVIGEAIVEYARDKKVKLAAVKSFKNIAGKGIVGKVEGKEYAVGNWELVKDRQGEQVASQGKTVVYVADKAKILGVMLLADKVKPESKRAVADLHDLGVKVAMMTGDNEAVAQAVARELSIDTWFAQVLPEDKYKRIQELQRGGNKVMMVGDGVNDAPALMQADVGGAIGAGTEVAVEAGDVVLMRNNPEDIVRLIGLARKVYRKMVENLVWATGYNVAAIPAAAGLFLPWGFQLTPKIGAILMSLSSVIVVANALRLRRVKL